SGRLLPHFRPDDSSAVADWTFQGEKGSLAILGDDAILRLYESGTGRLLRTVTLNVALEQANGRPLRHLSLAAPVRTPCFSPGGRRLFLEGDDGGLQVWDVETGKRTAGRPGPFYPGTSLKRSPDGRAVVVEGSGKRLSLWDLASNKRLASLTGQKGQDGFYD